MLNLLPTIEKKNLRNEYYIRLVVVIFMALTVVACVSGVFLVPSYITALYDVQNARAASVGGMGVVAGDREERDARTALVEANKRVSTLLAVSTSTEPRGVPSDIFLKILSFKNPSIKITGLSYGGALDQEQVVVTGIAGDRESLATFAEGLKKSGLFTTVELPVRSYVKSSNIDFSVTLSRTLKKSLQKTNATIK